MQPNQLANDKLDPETVEFYCQAIRLLSEARLPFLVGGAYALERYTGIARHTKDFDIFTRPSDFEQVLQAFANAGFETDITFPHWLGKAFQGTDFVDVIFGSGNGIAVVDDAWFEHAVKAKVLGMPVQLAPPEEMIWQKAFIMERERFDGADVAHILRSRAERIDWSRLLDRFDGHWRVLLSHLGLFGFIYPTERAKIPRWVMDELLARLQNEMQQPPISDRVCLGTLLSRAQYLIDLVRWGYEDARIQPRGRMTRREVAHWTAAIDQA
jgi:hypothetical protein